jgi:hypothetical protein
MAVTRRILAGLTLALVAASAAQAQPRPPRPDLADTAQGVYAGDVISDARGSSQEGVGVTVTKTGPNTVQVVSDYPRVPTRTFKLTRAMQTIQNVGGTEVFLLDLSKSPPRLDLTIDDASWSGEKSSGGR